MTRFGLDDMVLEALRQTFRQGEGSARVLIFGSRARGDFKPHSDVDMAVDAPSMSPEAFQRIARAVEDIPMIFPIDILHLQSLAADAPIRAVIARDGVEIFPNLS